MVRQYVCACIEGMLKKLPKSRVRESVVTSVKLFLLADVVALGVSYYVWRKMCRQQGMLNFLNFEVIAWINRPFAVISNCWIGQHSYCYRYYQSCDHDSRDEGLASREHWNQLSKGLGIDYRDPVSSFGLLLKERSCLQTKTGTNTWFSGKVMEHIHIHNTHCYKPFKSWLCTAWHCAVFSSSLHSWLQHGFLLILIQRQLMMLINLHLCGLSECIQ